MEDYCKDTKVLGRSAFHIDILEEGFVLALNVFVQRCQIGK